MLRNLARPAFLLAAVPALTIACSDVAPSVLSEDEIVGGVAARGSRLDAIGSLMVPDPLWKDVESAGEHRKLYCTGALIAPRLVLTAKGCVPRDVDGLSFQIGDDATRPKRAVRVERAWSAALDAGGLTQRGANVAVLSLEEPIAGVEPLRVLGRSLSEELVGSRFSTVGFGNRARVETKGLRDAGTLTLRATEGAPLRSLFESEDALVEFARGATPEEFDESNVERLHDYYRRELLSDYEAYLGLGDGDAQPCGDDSGGPLLARIGDHLVVAGVQTGSFKLIGRSYAKPCSVLGAVYATFGPAVQSMLDEVEAAVEAGPERVALDPLFGGSRAELESSGAAASDPCRGTTRAGSCVDGAALRCLDESEGQVHATRTDCTLLLQDCRSDGEEGARCVDP